MVLGNVVVSVEILDRLENGSPASARLFPDGTAMLRIGKIDFLKYPQETRMFIVFHELGHAVLRTGNEFLADKYAIKQYVLAGYDLSKAVQALTRILDPQNNKEHSDRIRTMFYRVKHASFLKNKITAKRFAKTKI
jgi:hypothetical protein